MAWSAPPNWTNLQVVSEADMDTYVTANTQHLYDIVHGVVNEALTILGDTTFRDDGLLEVTLQRNSTDAASPRQIFRKSRGTNASKTIVANGDVFGDILWAGYDGAAFINAAYISGGSDGVPGVNDMPGALFFYTTPDGSTALTERMRINALGQVLISDGNDGAPGASFINDTNTGITRAGTDILRLTAGGVGIAAAQIVSGAQWFNIYTNLLVNQQNANGMGSATGAIGIGDAQAVPATNPTTGGVLYSQAGALKWRGSSGTITTLGAA